MPKPKMPVATPEQFEGNTLMAITTRNYKRVSYIALKLDQPLTVIGGDNEAGKSSLIDSFGACMSGKLEIEMQPIKNGHAEGWVRCDFGDGKDIKLSVTRVLRRVGESGYTDDVSVKIPGHIAPSQIETFLRNLTGAYAFDPREFDEMTPEKQFEAVKRLIGNFDFAANAKRYKAAEEERRNINRDWGVAQAAADAIVLPGEPAYDADLESALAHELQEAGIKNTDRATRAANREAATAKIETLLDAVAKLPERVAEMKAAAMARYEAAETMYEQQIAELQRQIEKLRDQLGTAHTALQTDIEAEEKRLGAEAEDMQAAAVALQTRLDGLGPLADVIEPAAIMTRLEAARAASAKHAAWAQLRDRRKEYVEKSLALGEQSDELSKRLKSIEGEKVRAIESAKLPVTGIGIADGYITLEATDGSGPVPWAQASEAARIDASLSLAMAMNPKLKVVLIRNGSGIGKRIRERIQSRAAEKGYRVILEVVDEGEGTTVVIEDGHVRGQSDEPPVETVAEAEAEINEVATGLAKVIGGQPADVLEHPDLAGWRT